MQILIGYICYADEARDLVRKCIEREDKLTSGHLEFKCTVQSASELAVEPFYFYFEWTGEERFRIGYTGEDTKIIAVSDGKTAFLSKSEMNLSFLFAYCREDIENNEYFKNAIIRAYLKPMSSMAVTIGQDHRGLSTADLFFRIFPVKYHSDGLIEKTDELNEIIEIEIAFPINDIPSCAELYEIDVVYHMPVSDWGFIDDNEPEKSFTWVGHTKIDGIYLPERLEYTFQDEKKITIELLNETSWIGPVDKARFSLPPDNNGLRLPLHRDIKNRLDLVMKKMVKSIIKPPNSYIALGILLVLASILFVRKKERKTDPD